MQLVAKDINPSNSFGFESLIVTLLSLYVSYRNTLMTLIKRNFLEVRLIL